MYYENHQKSYDLAKADLDKITLFCYFVNLTFLDIAKRR